MSLKNKVASEATEALEQQVANLGAQSIGVDTDVSKLADLQKLIDNASVSPRQFENDGLTDSAIAGPGAVATPINLSTMKDPAKLAQVDAAIPLGRRRGGVPRRTRGKLSHRNDHLRRRRDHARQRRPLVDRYG
jgi:hypothetical protein